MNARSNVMTCFLAIAMALCFSALAPVAGAAAQKNGKTAPEIFRGKAKVTTATSAGDALVAIEIDQYTPERDIQNMEQALKTTGSAGFLAALRRAPVAGRFRAGDQTFTIRWARQRPSPTGRVISIVVDSPVYFVGGGLPGAKPREGFDVAVVHLVMDSAGIGEGTLAAAAKVKPGGDAGVEIEDYASEPIKLVSMRRVVS
jgi:hypothetical protein